jgi:hypothetical protein
VTSWKSELFALLKKLSDLHENMLNPSLDDMQDEHYAPETGVDDPLNDDEEEPVKMCMHCGCFPCEGFSPD